MTRRSASGIGAEAIRGSSGLRDASVGSAPDETTSGRRNASATPACPPQVERLAAA
jgi:hypothetical protein